MNIILGFGITEKDFEEQEINFVQDFIKKNTSADYFSDEFVKN